MESETERSVIRLFVTIHVKSDGGSTQKSGGQHER